MPGRAWSHQEISLLKFFLEQGVFVRSIRIGPRSSTAIRNRAARLNLIGDGVSRRQWPSEDEQTLYSLFENGWSVRAIAEAENLLPGYSRNAVAKKAGRLNLVDKERSRRAKQAVRFTPTQRRKFCEFLRERSQRCTPEQIAIVWNRRYEPKVCCRSGN